MVLDTSLALAYIFPDETTSPVRNVIAILSRTAAWVPSFWHIELGNSLEMALRRGRISRDFRRDALANLRQWSIQVDRETDHHAWTDAWELAERHRLTLYDAAYLELALRRNTALATLDKALRWAGEAEGVVLLGLKAVNIAEQVWGKSDVQELSSFRT